MPFSISQLCEIGSLFPALKVGVWISRAAARKIMSLPRGLSEQQHADETTKPWFSPHRNKFDIIVVIPDPGIASHRPIYLFCVLRKINGIFVVDSCETQRVSTLTFDPSIAPNHGVSPALPCPCTQAVCDIAEMARQSRLTLDEIRRILGNALGSGKATVYPDGSNGPCCDYAYFVVLEGPMGDLIRQELASCGNYRTGHGPWTFPRMLETIIRHMQEVCAGTTSKAVLITDSWDGAEFEYRRRNLERIAETAELEVYLIGQGRLCTRIWW